MLAPLIDLGPSMSNVKLIMLGELIDGSTAMACKGGYKDIYSTGMQTWDAQKFKKAVSLWQNLFDGCKEG